jgi:hypothetical protein
VRIAGSVTRGPRGDKVAGKTSASS